MSPTLQTKPRALQEVRQMTAEELRAVNSRILVLENKNVWDRGDIGWLDHLKRRRSELQKRLDICDGEDDVRGAVDGALMKAGE